MSQENADVVQRGLEAFNRHDAAALRRSARGASATACSPDFALIPTGKVR
jgi:hypothetical protein